eukprot:409361_1
MGAVESGNESDNSTNEQSATTIQSKSTHVYISNKTCDDIVKILKNYAFARLLTYYSQMTEHKSIIKQYHDKVVEYFRVFTIDGNLIMKMNKNIFAKNVIKFIATDNKQNEHFEKGREILFTLYRIIFNYESYLDTSSNTSDDNEQKLNPQINELQIHDYVYECKDDNSGANDIYNSNENIQILKTTNDNTAKIFKCHHCGQTNSLVVVVYKSTVRVPITIFSVQHSLLYDYIFHNNII